MRSEIVTVNNPTGIHARVANNILDISNAEEYKETAIYLEKVDAEGRRVNAKSLMGLLSLGICAGEKIKLIANGPHEDEAVTEIIDFLETAEKEAARLNA